MTTAFEFIVSKLDITLQQAMACSDAKMVQLLASAFDEINLRPDAIVSAFDFLPFADERNNRTAALAIMCAVKNNTPILETVNNTFQRLVDKRIDTVLYVLQSSERNTANKLSTTTAVKITEWDNIPEIADTVQTVIFPNGHVIQQNMGRGRKKNMKKFVDDYVNENKSSQPTIITQNGYLTQIANNTPAISYNDIVVKYIDNIDMLNVAYVLVIVVYMYEKAAELDSNEIILEFINEQNKNVTKSEFYYTMACIRSHYSI